MLIFMLICFGQTFHKKEVCEMKYLFELLRETTLTANEIITLQAQKNKSQFIRNDLKFKKQVFQAQLRGLTKQIEEFLKNKE